MGLGSVLGCLPTHTAQKKGNFPHNQANDLLHTPFAMHEINLAQNNKTWEFISQPVAGNLQRSLLRSLPPVKPCPSSQTGPPPRGSQVVRAKRSFLQLPALSATPETASGSGGGGVKRAISVLELRGSAVGDALAVPWVGCRSAALGPMVRSGTGMTNSSSQLGFVDVGWGGAPSKGLKQNPEETECNAVVEG